MPQKQLDPTIRFAGTPIRDGRTDGRTDRHKVVDNTALRWHRVVRVKTTAYSAVISLRPIAERLPPPFDGHPNHKHPLTTLTGDQDSRSHTTQMISIN